MDKSRWAGWRFLPQKPPWYLWVAVAALVLGSIFMSIGNISGSRRQQQGQVQGPKTFQVGEGRQEPELMLTARELEAQLQGILEKVAGSGRVAVRVSLKAGPLKEFATNTKTTRNSVEEREQSGGTRLTSQTNEDAQLVMARSSQLNGAEVPVVVRESHPEVLGVVVVAEGAEEPLVRQRLIQAVQTLWGLAPHQVQVLPMENAVNRR